jgi:hypothetical protein
VFQLNPAGLNWARAVLYLDIALVPLIVVWATGYEQYLTSAMFGALLAWTADPGGSYGRRVSRVAAFAAIGAGLTALGFGIGGDAWGWLVLAATAVTLAASLAGTFGVRRYVTAFLLNIWFIIALASAFGYHQQTRVTQYTWAQTLAWTGGAALWIVATFVAWLIRGRKEVPQPIIELPGDITPQQLTGPVATFAILRATVIAGTTALAFGANLSHGLWLPIAAMIAMKPDLEQSTVTAVQRLAGAVMGAAAAILLLLIPAHTHGLHLIAVTRGLEVVALVLFAHAQAVNYWNYAAYSGAIAAGVLLLTDRQQPTDYSAEGYRVLWTLCGVAIGVAVMFLADLLVRQKAKTPPQPPADVPAQRKTTTDQVTGATARPGK